MTTIRAPSATIEVSASERTQTRDHSGSTGSFQLDRDLDRLFSVDATDVLVLEVSYWLSP